MCQALADRPAGHWWRETGRALRRVVRPREERPVPPSELIWRVTSSKDEHVFLESGRMSAREMREAVSLLGRPLEDHQRILDFGCGCGRVLLWLDDLGRTGVDLIGTDIDADAVAWARENVPYARFILSEGLPPLDLADGSVDLVLNHSVFTHLDESHQDAWLSELRRVTKPGGTVLLTVHGLHAFESTLPHWRTFDWYTDHIEQEWEERGFVFLDEGLWRGTFPEFYRTTFHAPWYVFRHWSRLFDIKAYLVRGSLDYQDFVLMQRPAADDDT